MLLVRVERFLVVAFPASPCRLLRLLRPSLGSASVAGVNHHLVVVLEVLQLAIVDEVIV
jgi:hypothetical protein